MIISTIVLGNGGHLVMFNGGNFNHRQNVSVEGLKLFPCLTNLTINSTQLNVT